jgi:monothiol glutaredoxin
MSEELRSSIDAAVGGSRVHLFMKGTPEWPQCGFSKASCDVFRALGVEFTATNVLENLDAYRATLGEMTQWPTIPQIFVDGEFIGGCDILIEMYNQGELQKLLGAESTAAQGAETTAAQIVQ